jgi:uncharacterized membrane protein YjjP (DUF1212 family)
VDVLQVLGWALLAASIALMVEKDFVIKHVTSRSLGSLAPGYAATQRGYWIYAGLVGSIGVILLALHFGNPWFLLLAVAGFIYGSVAAILGEVRTYRALKR